MFLCRWLGYRVEATWRITALQRKLQALSSKASTWLHMQENCALRSWNYVGAGPLGVAKSIISKSAKKWFQGVNKLSKQSGKKLIKMYYKSIIKPKTIKHTNFYHAFPNHGLSFFYHFMVPVPLGGADLREAFGREGSGAPISRNFIFFSNI